MQHAAPASLQLVAHDEEGHAAEAGGEEAGLPADLEQRAAEGGDGGADQAAHRSPGIGEKARPVSKVMLGGMTLPS